MIDICESAAAVGDAISVAEADGRYRDMDGLWI